MAVVLMNAQRLYLPAQDQAVHIFCTDGGRAHEALPPVEELLAINGCWKEKIVLFFPGIQPQLVFPCSSVTLMFMWAALIGLHELFVKIKRDINVGGRHVGVRVLEREKSRGRR